MATGITGAQPHLPDVQRHADRAWAAAGLDRITPHECRHSKAVQTFMGHASVTLMLDTYGHLMPGSAAQAAELVESYLSAQHDRAEDAARASGGVLTGAIDWRAGRAWSPEAHSSRSVARGCALKYTSLIFSRERWV